MTIYHKIPATVRQVKQYNKVQLFPNTVAVVLSFACLSADMSGIAEYACIAIHRSVPAIIMVGFIFIDPQMKYPINHGIIYRMLNIPSRNGMVLALMGLLE